MKKHFLKKDVFIFIIGLTVCCYPIISNYIEQIQQRNQIATYQAKSNSLSENKIKLMFADVEKWNKDLLMKQKGLTSLSELNYDELLDIGNGVIGSIEIPKIKVDMPIYHTVDDNVLSIGAGHLEDSSLPIGSKSAHVVLTGHRGLPSSKLFTRLDELEKNDLFYIKVLNRTLAYRVSHIEIVKPNKVKCEIEENKDLVTLITCTPYGINTDRLVITGIRVPYHEGEKNNIESSISSLREILFYGIPVVLSVVGILVFKRIKE